MAEWTLTEREVEVTRTYHVTEVEPIQSTRMVLIQPDRAVVVVRPGLRFDDHNRVRVKVYGFRILKGGPTAHRFAVHGLWERGAWPQWLRELVAQAEQDEAA